MKRRFRLAGTALGALLVPACVSVSHPVETSSEPRIPAPRIGYRPPYPVSNPARTPAEQFAAGRPEPSTTITSRPVAKTPPSALVPTESPREIEQASAKVPVIVPPPAIAPTIPSQTEPLRLPAPIASPPPPEPIPDAEGVIRPPRPVLGGAPVSSDIKAPPTIPSAAVVPGKDGGPLLPTIDPPPATADAAPAAIVIPPSPGPVIGSSTHEAKSSPAGEGDKPSPTIPPAAPTPFVRELMGPNVPSPPTNPMSFAAAATPNTVTTSANDSPLLLAVRAFQANRPQEASEHLSAFDPATQQMLLGLMPVIVGMAEGRLNEMKAEELDALLENMARLTPMLRPRASLRASPVQLCREVHNFAHVERFPDNHTFRAGEVVHLYIEMSNFSVVSDDHGRFRIDLASSMELRDSAGKVAWRADPRDVPDVVSTAPQDYYRAFRLAIPAVAPGKYVLTVKMTDRPTGREVRKSVDLRVSAR